MLCKGLCPRPHSSNRFSEGALLCISVKPKDISSKYNSVSLIMRRTEIYSTLYFIIIQFPI